LPLAHFYRELLEPWHEVRALLYQHVHVVLGLQACRARSHALSAAKRFDRLQANDCVVGFLDLELEIFVLRLSAREVGVE